MPNNPNYGCTVCKAPVSRDALVVKKALFTEMGEGARTVRSRVIAWLCPQCLISDPDYQREKFSQQKAVTRLAS